MLTTWNGNCPTLLFKDLYESKSNWNEGDGSQTHSSQSLSTEQIVEIVSAVQIVYLKVSYTILEHTAECFFHLNVVLRWGMMSDYISIMNYE